MLLFAFTWQEVSGTPEDNGMFFTLLHEGDEQIIFFKPDILFAAILPLYNSKKYNDDCFLVQHSFDISLLNFKR